MNNKDILRILVVDDTAIYRKIVSDTLSGLPDVEVVGIAQNGKIALSRIPVLKPDLLILDIEMPEMNGLDLLANIKEKGLGVEAIMLSTLTHEGSQMTMKAFELGAFDFIPKPQKKTQAENIKAIKDALYPILKAYKRRKEVKDLLNVNNSFQKNRVTPKDKENPSYGISAIKSASRIKAKSEIVAIGISTGGPRALAQMLPMLPEDINIPILIVQHMPPMFTKSLATSLDPKCKIKVKEAVDGQALENNIALIAPGGKQMKIVAGVDGKTRIVRITNDPPENNCRPSADYLFRSVAHYYIGRSTGVIMTGMGRDGSRGLELMKKNGSTIIAQDEATCTVYGMPREVINNGIADIVVPLDRIADKICRTIKGTSKN